MYGTSKEQGRQSRGMRGKAGTFTAKSGVSAVEIMTVGDAFFPNYTHLEWVERKTPEVKMSFAFSFLVLIL